MIISTMLVTYPAYKSIFNTNSIPSVRGIACLTNVSFSNLPTQYAISSSFDMNPEIRDNKFEMPTLQFTCIHINYPSQILIVGTNTGVLLFFKYGNAGSCVQLLAVANPIDFEIDFINFNAHLSKLILYGAATTICTFDIQVNANEIFGSTIPTPNTAQPNAEASVSWIPRSSSFKSLSFNEDNIISLSTHDSFSMVCFYFFIIIIIIGCRWHFKRRHLVFPRRFYDFTYSNSI